MYTNTSIKYYKHPITEIVLKLTQIIQLENPVFGWKHFCSLLFCSSGDQMVKMVDSCQSGSSVIIVVGCAPLSISMFLFGIHFGCYFFTVFLLFFHFIIFILFLLFFLMLSVFVLLAHQQQQQQQ